MRRLASLAFLALVGCTMPIGPGPRPDDPVPVDPVDPPPPPPPVGAGEITQTQFDAVAVGASEGDVVAALGRPFREHSAAGFRILTYVVRGTSRSAFVWVKAGLVDHKSETP